MRKRLHNNISVVDKKILAIYKANYFDYDLMLEYEYGFQAMVERAKTAVFHLPTENEFLFWVGAYGDEWRSFEVFAYTLDEWKKTDQGAAYGVPDKSSPFADVITIATPDGLETFIIE